MPIPDHLTAPPAGAKSAEAARRQLTRPDLPKLRPNHPFFYVFHPNARGAWFVAEIEAGEGIPEDKVGVWWLPQLTREPVVPGLNGHRTRKENEPPESAYMGAHTKLRTDGAIILGEELKYRIVWDVMHPKTGVQGEYHTDAWTEPLPSSIDGKATKFRVNRNRYYLWLLYLIEEGIIPEPNPALQHEYAARFAKRVVRVASRDNIAADAKAELVEAATLESDFVAEAATPKRGGGKGAGVKAEATVRQSRAQKLKAKKKTTAKKSTTTARRTKS